MRKDVENIDRLVRDLLLKTGPAVDAENVCRVLKISQPVFSRAIKNLQTEILVTGRARATRYSLKRQIPDIGQSIPIYEVDEKGESNHIGDLLAVAPSGFYMKAVAGDIVSKFYDDLPYYLNDLRPRGFLGRLIPLIHKNSGFPLEITQWSGNDCLRYFVKFGWNLIGNLIVGDEAYQKFQSTLAHKQSLDDYLVRESSREASYQKFAEDILSFGEAGSSAGGEQPKLVAIKQQRNKMTHVIVKFSPPVSNIVAERYADLLICEHIAHGVLEENNQSSLRSEVISFGERVFLEVERFDRVGLTGRKGIISLGTLDAEFAGIMTNWSAISEGLFKINKIDEESYKKICWLEHFGDLIGNTDMHPWNMSFYCHQESIYQLAPVYDMLPMYYAPHNGELKDQKISPKFSNPRNVVVWKSACAAAIDYWDVVATDKRISKSFRKIAKGNKDLLCNICR